MFNRILVTLDGSPFSERILVQVARLLHREDAEVDLLRVVEPQRGEPEWEVLTRKDGAQVYLQRLAESLQRQGARTRTLVRLGDPAAEILQAVAEEAPDLVAMASHGRRGPARWVRGSVAERVLRRCTAPLLLINPEDRTPEAAGRFARILVPLDGSARSERVMPLVEGLAALYGSSVILLHVAWSQPLIGDVPLGALPPPPPDPASLEALLRPAADRLRAANVPVTVRTACGLEADEILASAEAEDADLVMMSTHGRGGLDRWVLGSVAENVLRHCRRPVMVVRAGAFEPPPTQAAPAGAQP